MEFWGFLKQAVPSNPENLTNRISGFYSIKVIRQWSPISPNPATSPLEHKTRTHVSRSFHKSSVCYIIHSVFYFGLVRVLSLRYCWGEMPSICLNTFENRLELSKPTLEAISVRFELP